MDTIADFLTIIRNGIMASKPFVVASHSKIKADIANILKEEGFIRNFAIEDAQTGVGKNLKVSLKYVDGESVIHNIKRISAPGRRTYKRVSQFKPVVGGLGVSILTTDRGIISNKKAKKFGVGGEIICTVW
jgi:small subunit ribosomal protein S8